MLDNEKRELALYRLEKAKSCLNDAKLLLDNSSFMAAANRAYYSIFHSARAVMAVMAVDGEDRKHHSGVIAYFQEHYVKTNIFGKEYSHILQNAFEIRQESDYEDFYVVSKDEAIRQVENANSFVAGIGEYILSL